MFLLLAAAPNDAAAESGLDLASSLADPAFGVCSFTYKHTVITKFQDHVCLSKPFNGYFKHL